MHKLITWSCIVGLVAASTSSFAAVKVVKFINGRKIIETIDQNLAWSRKAANRPQRVTNPPKVASKSLRHYRRGAFERGMSEAITNELRYVHPNVPKTLGPARTTKPTTLVQQVEQAVDKSVRLRNKSASVARNVSRQELLSAWKDVGGKMLYDDQIKLVRDVVSFYEKQGQTGQRIVGPDGLELVRYELPLERMILYDSGRDEIQILNADQYCVIYDPADRYGQVISTGALKMFAPDK